MNQKTGIQFFLLLIVLLILLVIFLKYFSQETSSKKMNDEEKKVSKVLSDKSNIIKNIEYFSQDDSGGTYNITAETGKIMDKDSNIIFLKNVKAKIKTLNSEDIFIESNFAKYNTKNYNTNFYGKANVKYGEHKINCKYLDLLFEDNLAILYEDVVYKNLETKLFADRLEIDLITKNSKLSMKEGKEKIKIVYIK